ncbi:MAG TPA: DUF948 domain-containing protein [Steroidobacteraceae bacterium]|jgi:hypothetical protein|nr:DUF948 domain-containing protein [Steroidobacteraceae bacterium]
MLKPVLSFRRAEHWPRERGGNVGNKGDVYERSPSTDNGRWPRGRGGSVCRRGETPEPSGSCARSTDIAKFNKRFDEVQQTLSALQTQSTQAASDAGMASTNTQRQIENVSNQIAALNQVVVAVGRH